MMDVGLSPDIPAYWCYTIVWCLGLLSAKRQIGTQLSGRTGMWMEPRVHLLVFIYSVLPVVLFWFLDRGGAIADTALIGALLVGLSYRQIVSGTDDGIKAPADASRFLALFQSYADPIAQSANSRIDARLRRDEDRMVRTISREQALVDKLIEVARLRHPDQSVIDSQVARIAGPTAAEMPTFVRERVARIVLALMLSISDRDRVLRDAGVIPRWKHWFWSFCSYSRVGGTYYLLLYPLALLLLIAQDTRNPAVEYYVWRIGKPHATASDQFRSRTNLVELLTSRWAGDYLGIPKGTPRDPSESTYTARALGRLLCEPGLPPERGDLILQTLLEARSAGAEHHMIDQTLVDALHAGNPDMRRRLNDALITLAKAVGPGLPKALEEWDPTKVESIALLEQRIGEWRAFWDRVHKSAPPK